MTGAHARRGLVALERGELFGHGLGRRRHDGDAVVVVRAAARRGRRHFGRRRAAVEQAAVARRPARAVPAGSGPRWGARPGDRCRRPTTARRLAAASRTTWALVPAMPKELTPPRAGPALTGQGRCRSQTSRPRSSHAMAGFGVCRCSRRRQLAVVEGERHLDQPGDTGRALGVADVRLHRADEARLARPAVGPDHRAEGAELDGIAGGGAGAVRLDVLHRARVDAGVVRTPAAASPPGPPWPGVARKPLLRPSFVTALPADDRVDRVAVGQRRRQPLQHDHRGAVAAHVPVGGGVAELAAAVGRHHAGLRVGDRDVRFEDHVGAAGEGHLALAAAQALAREVHGDERRGARGVDRDARTAQVEEERDPARRRSSGRCRSSCRGRAHPGRRRAGTRSRSATCRRTRRWCSPPADRRGTPASSSASQLVSRSNRCCGSSRSASRGAISKKSASKPSTSARKPPHFDMIRPGVAARSS